ncbi:MAG: hydrogen gas-evolving membrane-bound hydrogenase subunit E [Actinomycetes bacterium]
MLLLLLAYGITAVVCLVGHRRLGAAAFPLATLPHLATLAWLAVVAGDVLDGTPVTASVAWVDTLDLSVTLRLDGFGLLMGLLVSGIGVLVSVFSAGYFSAKQDRARIAGLLTCFAGAMLGLVWADGLLTLFVFWELTSVASFLLIGTDDRSPTARAAALRALLVTGAGGLSLLAGLVLLGSAADAWTVSGVLAADPAGGVVPAALGLVLLGTATKSAQFPFQFWLPGAMAAPTPVSAYLHSATMVKAGIVVVARFAPVFADDAPWRPVIVVCGVASILLGGVRSMRQQDAKLALAHGTVSQLGLIMVLVGLGTPATTFAGVAVLLAHALFKAAWFLSVGAVDHTTGTRDLRQLRGVRRLPVLAATIALAAASMAAIPPTFGFVTKEGALEALLEGGAGWTGTLALVGVVAGSVLTVAYTIRLTVGMLGDADEHPEGSAPVATHTAAGHAPGPALLLPPALLAAGGLVAGLAAAPVGKFVARVAASLDPAAGESALYLWHGLTPALGLSAAALAGGTSLWWVTRPATRVADAPRSASTVAYDRAYESLLSGARRITGTTQSGSLPLYLGIVLLSLASATGAALAVDRGVLDVQSFPIANSPLEVAVCMTTALSSLGVVLARQRFGAALALGGSGYLLALVFLLQGAPDLAVTQFLVETVTVAVYVLVLARLPQRFSAAPAWAPLGVRVALSAAVGLSVAGFALYASTAREAPTVAEEYLERSVPEGGGRNVVNVILVDFRGFDTLGEITVLAIAGAGVVNLVAAARREQRRKQLDDGTDVEDLSGRAPEVWR